MCVARHYQKYEIFGVEEFFFSTENQVTQISYS
jgi:hypothetical protein